MMRSSVGQDRFPADISQTQGGRVMSTIKERPVRPEQSQSQLKAPKPERRADDGRAHEDEIRPLAYQKWQEAGCPVCDGVEFWSVAETEILRRRRR
jgi:Protein of unknown function (DUF2934)